MALSLMFSLDNDMTAPAITSLAMTEDYDIYTEVGSAGRTIDLACNHEVVSNLVLTRIQTEIDSGLWRDNPNLDSSLLAQQLRSVVRNTCGVVSTDFTAFEVTRGFRELKFGTFCFTVDCANSRECITL